MNSLSKPMFDKLMAGLDCSDIMHPWSKSCFEGNIVMMEECFKGSIVFFSIMYSMTILLKFGKISSAEYKALGKNFLRSLVLGTCHGASFVLLNCLARKLLGKFQYYTIAFIVPFLSGLNIVIDHPDRRNIVTTAFSTMAVEAVMRRLLQLKITSRSLKWETVCFMVCNGLLMHAVSLRLGNIQSLMWFFIPPKVNRNEICRTEGKACSHDGSCSRNIITGTLKYSSVGLLISMGKIVIPNLGILRTPLELVKKVLQGNMALAGFAGGYVGLYKLISCCLSNIFGTNMHGSTFVAGLLAGSTYWFNPSLSLLASLITILIKIYVQEMKRLGKIPDWHYQLMAFALSNALLFHVRVLHPKASPKFMINMMSLVSNGRSKEIYGSFEHAVHDYFTKNGILET